jgi:hypothetical protein
VPLCIPAAGLRHCTGLDDLESNLDRYAVDETVKCERAATLVPKGQGVGFTVATTNVDWLV